MSIPSARMMEPREREREREGTWQPLPSFQERERGIFSDWDKIELVREREG
jgi:hypothetical protein